MWLEVILNVMKYAAVLIPAVESVFPKSSGPSKQNTVVDGVTSAVQAWIPGTPTPGETLALITMINAIVAFLNELSKRPEVQQQVGVQAVGIAPTGAVATPAGVLVTSWVSKH